MKRKSKDNIIYLGVGLSIAAGFTAFMFYGEHTTGRIREIPMPILWGILSTPVIAALILERLWEYRRRRSLWVVSIVAATINVLAAFVAYSFQWNLPLIVWSSITGLWIIAILIVAPKFVNRAGGPDAKS